MTSWRDVLPIHPAVDLCPLVSNKELREIAEDIKKNGLREPVVLWAPDGCSDYKLLDGRNRLDAMEAAGLRLVVNGNFNVDGVPMHGWQKWPRATSYRTQGDRGPSCVTA